MGNSEFFEADPREEEWREDAALDEFWTDAARALATSYIDESYAFAKGTSRSTTQRSSTTPAKTSLIRARILAARRLNSLP